MKVKTKVLKSNIKCHKNYCKRHGHYKRKQKGGFLNRYEFTYADRDTANIPIRQLDRIAPGFVKKTGCMIDQIAQRRIQQEISQDCKKIERVALIIIKGAIYKFSKTR